MSGLKGWFNQRFVEMSGRLRFDCLQCGRPMWFPRCKHGKYTTCGGACAAAKRAAALGERKRACRTCGIEFIPRTTQVRDGQGHFCSQKCNVTSFIAMNSPEAQRKARDGWRVCFASGRMQLRRGPENNRWHGGKEAARIRGLQRVSEYKKRNPDRVREWAANRRDTGAGKLPAGKVRALYALQRGCCAACRAKLGKDYHLDHVEPVSKGGTNAKTNFQLLCRPCNLRKAAKDPLLFMQSLGFLL